MMKTPDEIKKGLRCLSHDRTHTLPCSDCEYHGQGLPPCRTAVHEDAIALTEQLEATVSEKERVISELSGKIGQLEAERDAAVHDLEFDGACEVCKHIEKDASAPPCNNCFHVNKGKDSYFEWRGVQKEDVK